MRTHAKDKMLDNVIRENIVYLQFVTHKTQYLETFLQLLRDLTWLWKGRNSGRNMTVF